MSDLEVLVAIFLPLTLGFFMWAFSSVIEAILQNLYVLPKIYKEVLDIKNNNKRRM